jgi:hypothetical protein
MRFASALAGTRYIEQSTRDRRRNQGTSPIRSAVSVRSGSSGDDGFLTITGLSVDEWLNANERRTLGRIGARPAVPTLGRRKGEQRPNMTDFDEDSDQLVQQHPTEYFRAAARFRTLEAEATTPRVKQHLRALIDEYEKLAGRAEAPAASLR